MDILLILSGFIFIYLVALWYKRKIIKLSKNKIHFYVARDMDGSLWLYLEKPIRVTYMFIKGHGRVLTPSYGFKEFGLNEKDFDNLKWEDEPIEVFLNLED